MNTPEFAIIIPSLDGHAEKLLASIKQQTIQPSQIVVVEGVSPNGRARNQGVAQTSAPILVFIDDDAELGSPHSLANMLAPLLADPSIGVSGASKLIPPDANWFQRWVAREIPRIEHPVVEQDLETNPDPPSFYCEITTTCCAMRRVVFDQVGGFDETLQRGVDTEFFVRLRRTPITTRLQAIASGQAASFYRFVLAANSWTYHPAPNSLKALLRKQFMYGFGHAQEVRRDPSRARGRNLDTPQQVLLFIVFRTLILIPNIFIPYSFAQPTWRLDFKPLKAVASYTSALGYIWGWKHDL
jgi:glycosyltransferase involved in cell wall biosynthesis